MTQQQTAEGEMTHEFDCGDIVEQNGNLPLYEVVGVIHDQERLFVLDRRGEVNGGDEFELHFVEVTRHWTPVDNTNISGRR